MKKIQVKVVREEGVQLPNMKLKAQQEWMLEPI